MDIHITIERGSIYHWTDVRILDEEGNQIGTKEELQLDFKCPEFPKFPSYCIKVEYPATQQKVLDAIKAKIVEVKEQIDRDEVLRQQIEDMGYLDFTMDLSE